MVLLLIESGANVYALTEGDTPFGLARLRRHPEICELLEPVMVRILQYPGVTGCTEAFG